MNVQVTQMELREIFELEGDVAPKVKRIEELKEGVKALLVARKPVELGRFDAFLIKFVSRSVPWKQAVVDYLGEKFAEQFKKRFQPHVRFDVRVEEHAVAPLWKGGEPGQEEANT
jgi:hypothetical protein